jgi:hypothetical protein
MDPSDVHPDLLGDALSHSGQRLAQLGSLLTSWAMVAARRAEQRNAVKAARDARELSALHDQERAAWQLARAGWAPARDRQWLAGADLIETARAWSAAAAYADTDREAAAAMARCEGRLRELHPYAMAWYDRLRGDGTAPFDAMRDALPLFCRAPAARPGGRGRQRSMLATADVLHTAPSGPEGEHHSWAAATAPGAGVGRGATPADPSVGDRTATQLAAESFPWSAQEALRVAAATQDPGPRARLRTPQTMSRGTRPT